MGGNTSKVTAQDKAILDLKLQRDKLQQYQKRITVLTDRETAAARQLLAQGHKDRALLALRRKKYQESLLIKTDAQLAQLQHLTSNVEFALIQKDVLFGLSQGTKVLKEIHAEMGGVEGVERLMAENEEARAYQEEISDLLNGRMSAAEEEEAEDELEALRARMEEEQGVKLSAGATPQQQQQKTQPHRQDLPAAPNTELPTQKEEEQETSQEEESGERQRETRQMLAA